MNRIMGLLTTVELRGDPAKTQTVSVSVSARHEARLADGRRLLLSDDRG